MRALFAIALVFAGCSRPAPPLSFAAPSSRQHTHAAQKLPIVGQIVRVRGASARVVFVAWNAFDEHVAEVQFENGRRDTVRVCEIDQSSKGSTK